MRKIIVCNIISLDGYYEGPGRNIMALPYDEAFDEYNADRLRTADILLLGKTTFEEFKKYWPPVADNRDFRSVEREISKMNNTIQKVVISDSQTVSDLGVWKNTTTIIKRSNSNEEIKKLKNQDGKDILIFGSHKMWNSLILNGLIDELHFMVGPALLGSGTPVFESESSVQLHLLDSRILNHSQLVLNRYTVAK